MRFTKAKKTRVLLALAPVAPRVKNSTETEKIEVEPGEVVGFECEAEPAIPVPTVKWFIFHKVYPNLTYHSPNVSYSSLS